MCSIENWVIACYTILLPPTPEDTHAAFPTRPLTPLLWPCCSCALLRSPHSGHLFRHLRHPALAVPPAPPTDRRQSSTGSRAAHEPARSGPGAAAATEAPAGTSQGPVRVGRQAGHRALFSPSVKIAAGSSPLARRTGAAISGWDREACMRMRVRTVFEQWTESLKQMS